MNTIQQMTEGAWPRERRVALAVNVALVGMGLLVLLAVLSRFWDLGSRALHHDESLHAFFSFQYYSEGTYKHDPLMHGPVLFHLTALGYWLFGVSDATSRIVSALLGVILVAVPWFFRDWLGRRGAVAAAGLVLISPTLLYYSRFIRHDIFLAVWTMLLLYGLWRYLQRGERFHLYLMSAGLALAISTKEVSFILGLLFFAFVALLAALQWAGRLGARLPLAQIRSAHLTLTIGGLLAPFTTAFLLRLLGTAPAAYTEAVYLNLDFLIQGGGIALVMWLLGAAASAIFWDQRPYLIASGLFFLIVVLFHSTLLTWPYGVASGIVGSLGYWLTQHGVARGDQPWYYYLMLLPLYEFLPLLLAVGVGGRLLRRRPSIPADELGHPSTAALWPYFNLWWLVALFAALSISGEKMPWLLVHMALPAALLGGWALDRLIATAPWDALRSPAALRDGLLIAAAWLAAALLVVLAFTARTPLGGTDLEALRTTSRWLGGTALLAFSLWALYRGRTSRSAGVTRSLVWIMTVTLLSVATVRFALLASFRNADLPNEPLIYTQTSPTVPELMAQLELMSERRTGGKDLAIAFDSETSWPFSWYLRDYPNRFFYGSSPESWGERIGQSDVVMVGLNREESVAPLVNGFIRHHYSMRPNFPEDYKSLRTVYQQVDDPANPGQSPLQAAGTSSSPLVILQNVRRAAEAPEARREFVDFLWNRRVTKPLGRFDFVVYIRPEVAQSDWDYGARVATVDPSLTRDPYRELSVVIPPAAIFDAAGTLGTPRDVVPLPDGGLAVSDVANHRVLLLAPDGTIRRTIGEFGTGPGQFNEPWGLAVAPDGTLYVADTWNHRIQQFDAEGEWRNMWGTFEQATTPDVGGEALFGPRKIVVDDEGNLLVSDTGNKRITRFAPTGEPLGSFGGEGGAPGQFREPVGLALAPDGTFYVADSWNRRVQHFAADFTQLGEFPVAAWGGEGIENKPYIAAGPERIWVTDPERSRVIEYDLEGRLLRVWGRGEGSTALSQPVGLAYARGQLWVADSRNARVVAFEMATGGE